MKISSFFVMLIASLVLLAGCDPNPVMRVQSVPVTSIIGVGSGYLGEEIMGSKIINSSSWISESGRFTYAVGVEVEIESDILKEIDANCETLHIRFGFTTGKPGYGTNFKMFDDARAIFRINSEIVERIIYSRTLLKSIVTSDINLFKTTIKNSL